MPRTLNPLETTFHFTPLPDSPALEFNQAWVKLTDRLNRIGEIEETRQYSHRLDDYVLLLDQLQNEVAQSTLDRQGTNAATKLAEIAAVCVHAFARHGLQFYEHGNLKEKLCASMPDTLLTQGADIEAILEQNIGFDPVKNHLAEQMITYLKMEDARQPLSRYANIATARVRKMQAVAAQSHLSEVEKLSQIKRHMHFLVRSCLTAVMLYGKMIF